MAIELRDGRGNFLGILNDRVVEIPCKSGRCGAGKGAVIIHRFSADTGVLLGTLKFKDPATRKGGDDGSL